MTLGAHAKGRDPELDEALARMPQVEAFLRQDLAAGSERAALADTIAALRSVVEPC